MTGLGDRLPLIQGPAPPKGDTDLIKAGWTRRFQADENRAKEARELYESMGLEVKIVPLAPTEFASACGTCPQTAAKGSFLVYTRKRDRSTSHNTT
ncbi:hypothetical protein H8D30_03025 [bacterium]|nr:hypothetical protein [bacterium]